jgi:hypothetical protein
VHEQPSHEPPPSASSSCGTSSQHTSGPRYAAAVTRKSRSLGERIVKHTNAEVPTGDAVRGLLDNEKKAAPATELEDCRKLCTEHMRPPMPGTNVEQAQFARTQSVARPVRSALWWSCESSVATGVRRCTI